MEAAEFSLQEFEVAADGAISLSPAVLRVMARSPQEAAERLLGEMLSLAGEPRTARVKVWRLDHNRQPIITMLYGRPAIPAPMASL